jgi:hypothetical protein
MLHILSAAVDALFNLGDSVARVADAVNRLASKSELPANTVTLGGVALGAVIAFAGNYFIQLQQRSNQRPLARMQVASSLRHWMNRITIRVYEARTPVPTGNARKLEIHLPEFRFESTPEQVAFLDSAMARRIFDLIHNKDDANDYTDAVREYQNEEDAVAPFLRRSAGLWLEAAEIYSDLAERLGWPQRFFEADVIMTMRGEHGGIPWHSGN